MLKIINHANQGFTILILLSVILMYMCLFLSMASKLRYRKIKKKKEKIDFGRFMYFTHIFISVCIVRTLSNQTKIFLSDFNWTSCPLNTTVFVVLKHSE